MHACGVSIYFHFIRPSIISFAQNLEPWDPSNAHAYHTQKSLKTSSTWWIQKLPDQERHQKPLPDGETHSSCQLHPLAITFCIGTKQSHNPRHMYSTVGIAFQWNLLNLTLTCCATVLGLHEALHKLAIWHQAARIARNMSSTSCWEDERNFKRTFFCLQIAPMRTTLTQTLVHSCQRMMLVTSTSRNDATGIAGLRYWTFETCWYEVPC